MHADAFIIGLFGAEISIRPYHFFVSLAIVVVVTGAWIILEKAGYRRKSVAILLSSTIVAALVGARMWNALINWTSFSDDPLQWVTLSAVGFSLYGGIICAVIVGYYVARALSMEPWKVLDRVIPFVGIGIALIRVGCYLRGCCFGKETDVLWSVHFPSLSPAHFHQINEGSLFLFGGVHAVHPTQLYEIYGALIASIVAWILLRKKMMSGIPALAFIIIFTLTRLITYFFRVMPENYVTPVWFYPALYIVILIASITLLIRKVTLSQKRDTMN